MKTFCVIAYIKTILKKSCRSPPMIQMPCYSCFLGVEITKHDHEIIWYAGHNYFYTIWSLRKTGTELYSLCLWVTHNFGQHPKRCSVHILEILELWECSLGVILILFWCNIVQSPSYWSSSTIFPPISIPADDISLFLVRMLASLKRRCLPWSPFSTYYWDKSV